MSGLVERLIGGGGGPADPEDEVLLIAEEGLTIGGGDAL